MKNKKIIKKICIFTGSRAEYGLLKPLMDEIKDNESFQLQIVASGMHLSPEFGLTFHEIEKDGYTIDEKIEMLLSSDSATGICKSVGVGIISYADALQRLKPDIVIVLGDRYEAFAFSVACYINRISIAHLYGGETTEGAFDEGFRHSITKMASIHFTSTEQYRKRVIQLGEHPDTVFNVGALGIDNIKKMALLSKEELEKILKIKFKSKNYLVTFHPETLAKEKSILYFKNLLETLEKQDRDVLIIFTKANADTEGRAINNLIDDYVSRHDNAVSFTSMGQLLYLSTMKYMDAVIGNSSSGIIEAPSFKIATINIGNRQKGRIKPESVIDCDPTVEAMSKAINLLHTEEFQKKLKNVENPYGNGEASKQIMQILKRADLYNIKKSFYDIDIVSQKIQYL